MIDAIKTLLNKTSELEERIDDLSSKQTSFDNKSNFICFSKGMINSTFLNSNKLLLAEFQTTANKSLYFQNQIELNVPTIQNVKFTLIVNNIAIYRSTRKLQAGYNQLTIMKGYTPLESETVELYLQITSEDSSAITIITDTLLVWGLHETLSNIHYAAIETKDKYLLSYLSDNSLFYSFIDKNESALNSEDFSYFGSVYSYSFVYLNESDSLYLFRIDQGGNLFYSDFNNYNEIFIDSNIKHISAAANGKEIVLSIVKDNKCYICEIDEAKNISTLMHINCNNIPIVKSFIYQNKHNGKHYLIMVDKSNSNYITQSIVETKTEHNYINAVYSITYSTYEANV